MSTIEERHARSRAFQAQLTLLKVMLESAKGRLSDREWHVLRACLLIYLQADLEREECA